jgi:4'-phosphopantetheinyl transferase
MDIDSIRDELGRYRDMLAPAERARAGRYRFARDRDRFIVRRGVLRALVARRLGCAPAAIRFACGECGKPSLERSDLRFNASHSRGMALYVFARGFEVGCDLERRDPRLAAERVAECIFSPAELRALRELAPALRTAAFFNGWTRKEAYLKARGCGLSQPPDSVEVSLAPGDPALLLRGCAGWSVRAFELEGGYHAAVVAPGTDWRLAFRGEAARAFNRGRRGVGPIGKHIALALG